MTGMTSNEALRKAAALTLQVARGDDRAVRAILSECTRYSDMRSLLEATLVTTVALVGPDQREQLAAAAERLIVNLDGDTAAA